MPNGVSHFTNVICRVLRVAPNRRSLSVHSFLLDGHGPASFAGQCKTAALASGDGLQGGSIDAWCNPVPTLKGTLKSIGVGITQQIGNFTQGIDRVL